MIRYLTVEQIYRLHAREIERLGGTLGVREPEVIASVAETIAAGFGDFEYYPTLAEKAACLGYSLIQGHPFLDGNKRTAYQAMDVFLLVNGYELVGDVDEQERVIFAVASGHLDREAFTEWVSAHIRERVR
jgi:death-on-curing protein